MPTRTRASASSQCLPRWSERGSPQNYLSLLIETIFSLDGIGLLGFESVLNRDYAVVFATLYILSLVGLLVNLLSDLTYTWVDPRIDFETREV